MRRRRRTLGGASLAVALLAVALGTARGAETRLVALTADGALVRFAMERPEVVTRVQPSGVRGRLVGLDRRPRDGILYALSDASDLYTLDAATGAATLVSTLTVPFDGGSASGVDFNPQADRLRIVGGNRQNLRVHVGLGAVAVDGALAYAAGDTHAGIRPELVAAAYTRSLPGASETKLFEVDAALDVLVLQDPPNDGQLVTVGPLGIDVGAAAGFDILSAPGGGERALLASGSTLYAVDLATGRATRIGAIGAGDLTVVGLTSDAAGTP